MKANTRHLVSSMLLIAALLLVLSGTHNVEANGPSSSSGGRLYQSGELLIKFKPGMLTEQSRALQTLAQISASKIDDLGVLGVERWQVPVDQELAIAEKLNELPGVEYAEPNYIVTAHLTPNDPYYKTSQWAHPVINSPAAWDLTTGSNAVIVAVIDTGVDRENTELQGRFVSGWDFANDDSDWDDDNGHGTHVAGIIAAAGNNGVAIAGMAWQTRIMPVKVLSGNGSGTDADTAQGITYAVNAGADIINISLGGTADSTTLHNAVTYAYNHGVLVVASGGNCGDSDYDRNGCAYENQALYPAAYDTEVFAVAATSQYNDEIASFSNRGNYIDIAAPGVNILSLSLNNGVATANGTSQAAPHVSGLAALLLAIDPSLTAQEIQTHIEAASVDLGSGGWDPDYGAGRIDAFATLERAIELSPPSLNPINNAGSDTYAVTWSAVNGATAYRLQESASADFASTTTYDVGSNLSYNVINRDGGIWYYRVQAMRNDITSDWSLTQSAGVLSDPPLLYPIVAGADPDAYTITWSTSTGASNYRLQESTDAGFTDVITRYVGSSTTYAVTGQHAGTWIYRVEAANPVGFSSPSNSRSFTVTVPDISTPVLDPILGPDSSDTYTVSWSTAGTVTGYILEESTSPWFNAPSIAYTGAFTQYVTLNQRPGSWHYRVRAQTPSGDSPWSAAKFVTVFAYVFLPIVMR